MEGALVTPFIMMMIMGVLWAALVFRSYLMVDHASANGARVASVAANSFDADWQILNAIKPSLVSVNKSAIERVIVYPATNFEDGPSAGCLASGTGCNVYTSGAFDAARPTAAGMWPGDAHFLATNRAAAGSATQLVGVYVQIKPGANGLLLPAPKTISEHKVLRLESRAF